MLLFIKYIRIENVIPRRIATVKSNITVVLKVIRYSAIEVLLFRLNISLIFFQSFIFIAVTTRMLESATKGTLDIKGARNRTIKRRVIPWIILERRVTLPLEIATLVLAIAAVEGIPPKKGKNVFTIPCA